MSVPASMIATRIDARAAGDARNDKLFRAAVTAAGLFVLVTLLAAGLSMFWGGR